MNTPRWVPILALAAVLPLLFGCASASGSSSTNSGNAAGLAITTNSLPDATVNQSYSDTLQASGGTAPYSWTASSSQIPTGMTLSTSGQLAGTPTQQGNYTFQVQVTDAASNSTSTNLSIKVTGPAPAISSITPNTGGTGGGTPVTINGNKLQSGATVTFGGVAGTSVNVVSSTQMTADTPAHAAGSVDVTVTNPGGKSATLAGGFGYQNAAPTISSINPTSGPTSGGTAVNITGAHFVLGAVVLFGSLQASSVTVTSAAQIQATSPAGSAGAVNVVVKNPDGQSATLSGAFSYTAAATGAPNISGLSPNTGPDGTQTLINGSNFSSGATVSFGGTQASSVQFVNTNQLSAVVPSISTGTVDVTVNDPGGATTTLSSGFTVTKPQSLLSGCTVDASNNPTCTIPSGWSLVAAQGFESGTIPSNQFLCSGSPRSPETIESGFAHTGTHALVGQYNGGDQQVCWGIQGSAIDSLTTYVSWWEYDEPQGKLNQDFFMMRRLNPDGTHDAELQFAASGCLFNCTSQSLYFEPHGGGWSIYQGNTSPGWGAWTQWEIEMTINPTGQSTGSLTAWRNGTQVFQFSGQDIATTYANWANADLRVGGVYTKLIWYLDSALTQCASGHASYTKSFSDWTQPDPCPNQAPPNGYVPIFKRYIDDIIVLKQ